MFLLGAKQTEFVQKNARRNRENGIKTATFSHLVRGRNALRIIVQLTALIGADACEQFIDRRIDGTLEGCVVRLDEAMHLGGRWGVR